MKDETPWAGSPLSPKGIRDDPTWVLPLRRAEGAAGCRVSFERASGAWWPIVLRRSSRRQSLKNPTLNCTGQRSVSPETDTGLRWTIECRQMAWRAQRDRTFASTSRVSMKRSDCMKLRRAFEWQSHRTADRTMSEDMMRRRRLTTEGCSRVRRRLILDGRGVAREEA